MTTFRARNTCRDLIHAYLYKTKKKKNCKPHNIEHTKYHRIKYWNLAYRRIRYFGIYTPPRQQSLLCKEITFRKVLERKLIRSCVKFKPFWRQIKIRFYWKLYFKKLLSICKKNSICKWKQSGCYFATNMKLPFGLTRFSN